MGTSKICTLSLFSWMCVESEGQKEVIPMCPKHPAAKARFANFGTGVIVTCASGNHLVRLCEREQFEAERAEAQSNLFPKP